MHKACIAFCLCIAAGASSVPAWGGGRQLTAGFALRQEFDSNPTRVKTGETPQWTTVLEPSLRLDIASPRHTAELRYSPGLAYNHRLDDLRFDHRLAAAATLGLGRHFSLDLRESYVRTDDAPSGLFAAGEAAAGQPALTADRQRRTYWRNAMALAFTWTMERGTSLTAGYRHTLLDNRSLDTSDYQRHEPHLELAYRWSPQWSGRLAVSHTVGDFDTSSDLVRHVTSAGLSYDLDTHRQVGIDLSRAVTDYDTGVDYTITSLRLAYRARVSARDLFAAAAGWAFSDRATGPDDDGFSFQLRYQRALEQGSLTISGESGFTGREFDGDDNGLTRFWSLEGRGQVRLARRLSADLGLGVSRRKEFQVAAQQQRDDIYEVRAGIEWQAARRLSVDLHYACRRVDAEPATGDSTDHRLVLAAALRHDLWKE